MGHATCHRRWWPRGWPALVPASPSAQAQSIRPSKSPPPPPITNTTPKNESLTCRPTPPRLPLPPPADALANVMELRSGTRVWLSLQGEMGATVFFYPLQWVEVAAMVRRAGRGDLRRLPGQTWSVRLRRWQRRRAVTLLLLPQSTNHGSLPAAPPPSPPASARGNLLDLAWPQPAPAWPWPATPPAPHPQPSSMFVLTPTWHIGAGPHRTRAA